MGAYLNALREGASREQLLKEIERHLDEKRAMRAQTSEVYADLVRRLRGEYRIPITDGLGPAGGEEPDNPNEFVRTFGTPPVQKEAADAIESLARLLKRYLTEVACNEGLYFVSDGDQSLWSHSPMVETERSYPRTTEEDDRVLAELIKEIHAYELGEGAADE